MPTQTCGERLKRGGLEAFCYSLPGIVLTIVGWVAFLVGFGWLNAQISFTNLALASLANLAMYYLVAISPPIYFVLLSLYMLTGMWAIGIICQVAATLVILAAGAISYFVGIFVVLQFETERVVETSGERPTLTEPEIYITVMFAGAVVLCIGMVYCMTLIPVVATFQHKKIFDDPYADDDDNHKRVHLKPTLFSLPATIFTALGWICYFVGFILLVLNSFRAASSHTDRWRLAGFYILAISTPIYFIIYFIYMLTGQWVIGIVSQFGAVVVTAATGGMAYLTGLSVTQLVVSALDSGGASSTGQTETYIIIAFAGTVILSIGMAISNALVPVMSGIFHNKPLKIGAHGSSGEKIEMSKRSTYGNRY